MPDPRLLVSFEGIDAAFASFKLDNVTLVIDVTQLGNLPVAQNLKAVSLSAASTIQLCADADPLVGKIVGADPSGVTGELFGTVQIEGFCALPGGLAAALTLGFRIVGATGAAAARGFIRAAVAAESIKQSAQITDNTDPTNCVVNW